jgi:hypothetical protein
VTVPLSVAPIVVTPLAVWVVTLGAAAVGVGVAVGVDVAVAVGVEVAVAVGVDVAVGVGDGPAPAAVTVNVEPFLYLQVVFDAAKLEGIKNTSTDVPAATITVPLKVDEIEEPVTPAVAVPKSVAAPPLLEVFTVKVPVPLLMVPSHVILERVKVCVASAVMVIL